VGVVGGVALVLLGFLLVQYQEKNSALEEQTRIVGERTGEVIQANLELEGAVADLQVERDRFQRVARFQEGLFSDLDPEALGASLAAGIRGQLQDAQEKRGGAQEGRLDTVLSELAVVNFTSAGTRALEQRVIGPAGERVRTGFPDDDLLRARLQDAIAGAHERLGEPRLAAPLRRSSLEIRRRILGTDDESTIRSFVQLSQSLSLLEEYEALDGYLVEGLSLARARLGPDHELTLSALERLGEVKLMQGEPNEAGSLLSEAYEGWCRTEGRLSPQALWCLGNLASAHRDQGDLERALQEFRDAYADCLETLGEGDIRTVQAAADLGHCLQMLWRSDEAEVLLVDALEHARRHLGEQHPVVVSTKAMLGQALISKLQFTEGFELFIEATDGWIQTLGLGHTRVTNALASLAPYAMRIGMAEESTRLFGLLYEGRATTLGLESPSTIDALLSWSAGLEELRRVDKALEVLQTARRSLDAAEGEAVEQLHRIDAELQRLRSRHL
jgi:tetratricopeptide (TPR) repeat protein